jgi:hypothetical protein
MTGTDRTPRLTEGFLFKTDAKTLALVISAIIGATIWCSVAYFDIQSLKAQSIETQRILSALSRQVDRIDWSINPGPTPTNPHHGGTP